MRFVRRYNEKGIAFSFNFKNFMFVFKYLIATEEAKV